MKAATIKQLKDELKHYSEEDLRTLTLRLANFKKENKELLTYLLFEEGNEAGYIESVREEMIEQLDRINSDSFFYMKKTIRKVLRTAKKYIRYSKKKETEVEILIHFCRLLMEISPSIKKSKVLLGIYERQIASIEKAILTLHEDLQHDYNRELNHLYL